MPNEISETFDQILQKELALLPGPQMWAIPQALVDSDRKFVESLKTSTDPLEKALWETFMATKPIPSPFNTAEKIIRKHLRWYLKKTGRSDYYPKFSTLLITGLVHDVFSRAGANMYGIWHREFDAQMMYIEKHCKTRVSRLHKYCHDDLIEWYITHRVMAPAVNSVWEMDWEDD